MIFDKNFFIKQIFSDSELAKYKGSAARDLDIAKNDKEPEVRFHFAYMALVKIGIYVLAQAGYRVKSRPGHHQKIIETLADILKNADIGIIGDKMRKERNLDFYSGEALSTDTDIAVYLKFVDTLFKQL